MRTAKSSLLLSLSMLLWGAGCAEPPTPKPERVDLDAYERTVTSQFGEDGVLEQIFEMIEPTSWYAVEFGAYDGIAHSNTRNLIEDYGWGSYQIEGHPSLARKLAALYEDNPRVTTEHAWVFPGNIEILFEEAGVPKDLDLLVIDIDSNDYYVWKAIHNFRPKVVMIESHPGFPPPQLAVIDFHPMTYWDKGVYLGASLQSLYKLGKSKGYELVHVMREGPNVIFVDEVYYDRFGIEDNSPTKMWRKRFGQGVTDPNVFPEGKETIPVDAFEIPKRWILDR